MPNPARKRDCAKARSPLAIRYTGGGVSESPQLQRGEDHEWES